MELSDSGGNFPARRGFLRARSRRPPARLGPPPPPALPAPPAPPSGASPRTCWLHPPLTPTTLGLRCSGLSLGYPLRAVCVALCLSFPSQASRALPFPLEACLPAPQLKGLKERWAVVGTSACLEEMASLRPLGTERPGLPVQGSQTTPVWKS